MMTLRGPVSAPPPAPFVRIEYGVGRPHYVVPSTGYLARGSSGGWYRLERNVSAALRRAAREAKPYAAPREWDENVGLTGTERTRGKTPVAWIAAALLILLAASVAGWKTRVREPSAA